jgi:type I restriction-modification system DNA methylase subunit
MSYSSIATLSDQEIIDQIDKQLTIHDHEKDKYGEVFTPSHLINEFLDNLPKDVWKNPDGKWLDPAAGTGNFLALVYSRLCKSLVNAIPDEKKRKTHILENMLYMVEINPKNVHHLRRLFGQKTHISLADFLQQSEKWKRDLKIDKDRFSVIIGNPPFQYEKKGTYDGSVGNRTLWTKFLDKILDDNLINEKGYLAFLTIHPYFCQNSKKDPNNCSLFHFWY